jgi:hypothetical protein
MLRSIGLLIIVICCLAFLNIARGIVQDREEALDILEMIARGYTEQNRFLDLVYVEGRLFNRQYAEEGKTIPDNKQMTAEWKAFSYWRKDGKRRYEQEAFLNEGKRLYVIDDEKMITSYMPGSALRYYPVDKEESRWADITGDYSEYFKPFGGQPGFENVALGMRNFQQWIREGKFDKEDCNFAIRVGESGVYTIDYNLGGLKSTVAIDGSRGYNVVKVTKSEYYKNGKWDSKMEQIVHFKQYAAGVWFPESAAINGIENGVVFDRRLEVKTMQCGDINVSDELFTKQSLKIEPNVYTEDHHFNPPLVMRDGAVPKSVDIASLLATPIARTEVATIAQDGSIKIERNTPYVSSRASGVSSNVPGRRRNAVILTLVAIGGLSVVFVLWLLVRRKKTTGTA